MDSKELFQQIGQLGVVPVLAVDDGQAALPLADALLEGELPVAEITFRTAAAVGVPIDPPGRFVRVTRAEGPCILNVMTKQSKPSANLARAQKPTEVETPAGSAEDGALFKPTERFYLNPDSPVPLYHQMEKIILDRITSTGAVGVKLPREMDLLEIFGVSRATVKKVTDNLVAKGLIRRRRAVGTHVVSLGIAEDLGRLTGYTEQMASRGLQVSTEVQEVGEHVPGRELRDKLMLAKGEKTLFIRRLRGTSEVFPIVLLRSEIPAAFGLSPKENFAGSLYHLIEQQYRIPIEWAEERISAGRASPEEAKHLQVQPGDVVLIMERLTFTSGNRPLEFVRAVYRPEHYTFTIRLKR